jgi:radical SAM superfamily enzyme YgiQ (UPF0313 family)
MPDIVLATLNAKYIHTAFGLRCLMANLGQLQTRACLMEFDIDQRPLDIAEKVLAQHPKIVGLGVYIWNTAATTELVALLKRIKPELILIVGGPEVSYETEQQEIVAMADYVITGEADLKFAEVCGRLLSNEALASKVSHAALPDFSQLALPYELYDAEDIAHRVIYVEASRGCHFTCEFCLSSLDIPVRQAPLPYFLEAMQKLLDRGVRHLKFVDRTFNLNVATSRTILEFFLERHRPGNFYHFEMIPDRLPEALREVIAKFPPGTLQFEVGVQTFNPEVAELIRRRQDCARLEDNFHFLREQTGVHIHADLIVGLPGESLESFAAGFDRLVALRPQEIQVGILKRLRGTPITRHDMEWGMVYSPRAPYEVLQTKFMDFTTMQKLRRFARYWDLVNNSGNFVETTPLLWSNSVGQASSLSCQVCVPRPAETGKTPVLHSPFHAFLSCSEWLHARTGRTDSIALIRLMELLFDYLTRELKLQPKLVAETLWCDYQRGGRTDKPAFLCEFLSEAEPTPSHWQKTPLKRQARHLAVE